MTHFKLFAILLFITLSFNLHSQDGPAPESFEFAPGTGFIMYSQDYYGFTGVYRHHKLDSLVALIVDTLTIDSGITIDSMKCFSDTLRLYTPDTIFKSFMDCSIGNEFQNLSIDSLNRIFTISISSGNSISFRAGMLNEFDGNRVVQRLPVPGSTNMGTTTVTDFLNWFFQRNYQPPTISMNSLSPSTVEVGSSTSYTLAGTTTNTCNYTLASGAISAPSGYSFGSATSYSTSYTHLPTTPSTTTLTASQAWTMTTSTCEAGTPTTGTASTSRTIINVYPILWGMSASDWSGGGIPYSSFQNTTSLNITLYKRIASESNLTGLNMYSTPGTPMYIYILIPKSWSLDGIDPTSILDHNLFNVKASFTAYDVTVTSTGLANNWTQNYKMFKLNTLTTASNYSYTYNR